MSHVPNSEAESKLSPLSPLLHVSDSEDTASPVVTDAESMTKSQASDLVGPKAQDSSKPLTLELDEDASGRALTVSGTSSQEQDFDDSEADCDSESVEKEVEDE